MDKQSSIKRSKDYIQENKAAFFDWLVLGISFSLGFVFPTLSDFVNSPDFTYYLLIALVLYLVGSWLKNLPLAYRFNRTGERPEEMSFLLFLLVGHWTIFLFISLFAEGAFRHLLGLRENADEATGGYMVFMIFFAVFITWVVFRSKTKIRIKRTYSPGFLFRRELVADTCLVIAVSIFTFTIWEKGIMYFFSMWRPSSIWEVCFLFIFFGLYYMMFYLPLRYLFLIEDHSKQGTWRRMLIIFGFILLRALFLMLGI